MYAAGWFGAISNRLQPIAGARNRQSPAVNSVAGCARPIFSPMQNPTRSQPSRCTITRLFDIDAPHFVMYVQDRVQKYGTDRLRDGGLRVQTTLDLDLQHKAEQSVKYRLDLLNCRKPGLCNANSDPNRRVENAAVVVLDAHSGEILAMVGSPNYFDERIQGNVNAALSLRQPGSAIKPLTYAVALDPQWSQKLGLPPLTAATIIPDLETTFYVKDEKGGNVPYQPINYDRNYHGPVSIRTALANSYNIPRSKH